MPASISSTNINASFLEGSTTHLIEHDAFRLEPVPRPDMLERVEDLLPVRVFLVPELVGRERQDNLSIKAHL